MQYIDCGIETYLRKLGRKQVSSDSTDHLPTSARARIGSPPLEVKLRNASKKAVHCK